MVTVAVGPASLRPARGCARPSVPTRRPRPTALIAFQRCTGGVHRLRSVHLDARAAATPSQRHLHDRAAVRVRALLLAERAPARLRPARWGPERRLVMNTNGTGARNLHRHAGAVQRRPGGLLARRPLDRLPQGQQQKRRHAGRWPPTARPRSTSPVPVLPSCRVRIRGTRPDGRRIVHSRTGASTTSTINVDGMAGEPDEHARPRGRPVTPRWAPARRSRPRGMQRLDWPADARGASPPSPRATASRWTRASSAERLRRDRRDAGATCARRERVGAR